METWVLILALYSSGLASSTSLSIGSVPGFKTEAECRVAGEQSSALGGMNRSVAFVCVKQGK